jgi:hypothetical protein
VSISGHDRVQGGQVGVGDPGQGLTGRATDTGHGVAQVLQQHAGGFAGVTAPAQPGRQLLFGECVEGVLGAEVGQERP